MGKSGIIGTHKSKGSLGNEDKVFIGKHKRVGTAITGAIRERRAVIDAASESHYTDAQTRAQTATAKAHNVREGF